MVHISVSSKSTNKGVGYEKLINTSETKSDQPPTDTLTKRNKQGSDSGDSATKTKHQPKSRKTDGKVQKVTRTVTTTLTVTESFTLDSVETSERQLSGVQVNKVPVPVNTSTAEGKLEQKSVEKDDKGIPIPQTHSVNKTVLVSVIWSLLLYVR